MLDVALIMEPYLAKASLRPPLRSKRRTALLQTKTAATRMRLPPSAEACGRARVGVEDQGRSCSSGTGGVNTQHELHHSFPLDGLDSLESGSIAKNPREKDYVVVIVPLANESVVKQLNPEAMRLDEI